MIHDFSQNAGGAQLSLPSSKYLDGNGAFSVSSMCVERLRMPVLGMGGDRTYLETSQYRDRRNWVKTCSRTGTRVALVAKVPFSQAGLRFINKLSGSAKNQSAEISNFLCEAFPFRTKLRPKTWPGTESTHFLAAVSNCTAITSLPVCNEQYLQRL